MYPRVLLLSIDTPTVPIKNKGLAFDAMFIMRWNSLFEIKFLLCKSFRYFVQKGYPQIKLTIKGKIEFLEIFRGLINNFPNSFPNMFIPP